MKTQRKLSKTTKFLVLNDALSKVVSIFLETFLAAYLYQISENSIYHLALYNILGYASLSLCAILAAHLTKRWNKVWLFRLSVVLKLSYIFLIIILGEQIIDYIWLVGVLYGMTMVGGFVYNMIESEQISAPEWVKYMGYANVANGVASIITPIVLGSSIFITSYQTVAIALLVVVLVQLAVMFFVHNKRTSGVPLKLAGFLKTARKDHYYWRLCLIEFCRGINRNGVMSLVISLLIIYHGENEIALGGLTSLFSVLGIVAMWLLAKFYNRKHKNLILTIMLIYTLVGCLAIYAEVSFTTVVIYNIAFYTGVRTLEKILAIELMQHSKVGSYKETYNSEYFLVREFFLNAGRIFGYFVLGMTVATNGSSDSMKALFIVIIASLVLMTLISIFSKEKSPSSAQNYSKH